MYTKEQWLDPRWQKKRLEILERDGWKCRYCRDDKYTLHVHHIMYDEDNDNPWDYADGQLITLCEDCHMLAHHMPFYLFSVIPFLYECLIDDLIPKGYFESVFEKECDVEAGISVSEWWGPLV